jgi:hypothetical protein
MPAITLRAHFDGTMIQLDEPYDLPPNARLIVTVLPPITDAEDREAWAALAAEGLAGAYGEDEPNCSVADVVS